MPFGIGMNPTGNMMKRSKGCISSSWKRRRTCSEVHQHKKQYHTGYDFSNRMELTKNPVRGMKKEEKTIGKVEHIFYIVGVFIIPKIQ